MTARRTGFVVVVMAVSACSVGTRDGDVTVANVADPPGSTGPATVEGAAPGTLVVDDGGLRTFECAGRDVHIAAESNIVTLRGTCPKLLIDSDGNVVDVERIGAITINGDGNVVQYVSAIDGIEPVVEDNGTFNVIDVAD